MKQFWLLEREGTYMDVCPGHPLDDKSHLIHAVDKASYDTLRVQAMKLREILNDILRAHGDEIYGHEQDYAIEEFDKALNKIEGQANE